MTRLVSLAPAGQLAPLLTSRLRGETALIAYIATLTGAVAAFICAAPASRNLMRHAPVRFTVRRILEFCRSVPDIVFAMIFVAAVGLGALPGVLGNGDT